MSRDISLSDSRNLLALPVQSEQNSTVCVVLVALLFLGAVSSTRKIEALNRFNFDSNTKILKQLTSDRVHLWEVSQRGISKRPLLGWGMNGFGTAYPHVINPNWVKITRLGDFNFDFLRSNGQRGTQALITVKAHNLILDTTLSVGILGLISYLALLAGCLWLVIKSPYRGIETVQLSILCLLLLGLSAPNLRI